MDLTVSESDYGCFSVQVCKILPERIFKLKVMGCRKADGDSGKETEEGAIDEKDAEGFYAGEEAVAASQTNTASFEPPKGLASTLRECVCNVNLQRLLACVQYTLWCTRKCGVPRHCMGL